MTTFAAVSAGPVIHRLAWAIVHSVWQLAAVSLLLACGLYLFRRRSANLRYVVACGALSISAVLPAITFWALPAVQGQAETVVAPPAINLPNAGLPRHGPAAYQPAARVGPGADLTMPASTTTRNWRLRSAAFVESNVAWIVAAWVAGVCVLSLRIVGSWIRAQGLRRFETDPPPAGWDARLADMARRLGLHKPIQLLQSRLARVPTVLGHLRPVILLPVAALTGLMPQQIEAILAHELAHIRRHDYLVNLLQVLAETVLFYHPAVWWMSRRIRIERENCCDDMAIDLCGDRFGYIRALVSMEELRDVPAPQTRGRMAGYFPARPRSPFAWCSGTADATIRTMDGRPGRACRSRDYRPGVRIRRGRGILSGCSRPGLCRCRDGKSRRG